MPPGRLSVPDYRALADFRYQLRRFLRFSDQAARDAGLEPQHHQLLLAVKGIPDGVEATVGTLAERLQVRHHSAVELVNRMEERGLVRRLRGAADRRQVLVTLTARGEALLGRLSAAHRAEVRSIAPRLLRALGSIVTDMEGAHAVASR
jgi:DNA-binding MarR family transcriptional regulator